MRLNSLETDWKIEVAMVRSVLLGLRFASDWDSVDAGFIYSLWCVVCWLIEIDILIVSWV